MTTQPATQRTPGPPGAGAITAAQLADVRDCLGALREAAIEDGEFDRVAWGRLPNQWSALWLATVGGPRLLTALDQAEHDLAAAREREATANALIVEWREAHADESNTLDASLRLDAAYVALIDYADALAAPAPDEEAG